MSTSRMLQRPIYGGLFGHGQYALATLPVIANGLHAVRFMVIEPRRGTVLSVADDKLAAIAGARRLLVGLPPALAANDANWVQTRFWPELPTGSAPRLRLISRRRQEVFARSDSRCHYCHAPLVVDGPWHVEHMVPRALGGDDNASNLVAACASCNLQKGDRTALEFVAALRVADRGESQ